MNTQRIFSLSLSLIAAAVLSACASENDTTSSKEPGSSLTEPASIPARRAEGESKVLSDYSQYQGALDAAKRGDDMWVQPATHAAWQPHWAARLRAARKVRANTAF